MIQTKTISILTNGAPEAIQKAVAILNSDGLIAFPTDTIYGVAAPAFSQKGIERLYQVKARSLNKPIAILIGSLDQLPQVALDLSPAAQRLAERFWPGALTLVVARHPSLPEILSPVPTIGVRMPDYQFVLQLLRLVGPLATTSANLSGGANPLSAKDVAQQLDGKIELILDGGPTPGSTPSTVVDCTQPKPIILRQGGITAEMLEISGE